MTIQSYRHGIPEEILALSHERDALRKRGRYDRADLLKKQIEEAGYAIKDNPHGAHLIILPGVEADGKFYRIARHLPSLLDAADDCTFSVNIVGRNTFEQTRRCLESVLHFAGNSDIEVILVDNASNDELPVWADAMQQKDQHVHVLHITRPMGEAEARNVGMKRSRGRYILLLDSSIELVGDVFTPLEKTLADGKIGVTGFRGLRTDDLRHFEESQQLEVDAVDGLCLAFRRTLLKKVGLLDEGYRYARYMDIDFNFAIRDSGARALVTPGLPLICHPLLQDANLTDAECTRLTKRNFYRFMKKWGDREDLLVE